MSTSRSPSPTVGEVIAAIDDWRGARLSEIRELIRRADPDVVEELKWKKPTNPTGVPVWSDSGMICTGEVYGAFVKLTFAKGALLDDPHGLFNASLGGNLRRAIDIHEHDTLDDDAFEELVRAAVALNKPPS